MKGHKVTLSLTLAVLLGALAVQAGNDSTPEEKGVSDDIDTGILEGLVTDSEKAPLAAAQVKLRCPSTGFEGAVVTGKDGRYRLEDVPAAADCILEISAPGRELARMTQDRIVIVAQRSTVESVQLYKLETEQVIVSAKRAEGRVVQLEEVGSGRRSKYKSVKGNPNVMGARAENFRTVVDGVSNQDPLSGTWSTESYAPVTVNPFRQVLQQPVSTFSIDVDTASYTNVRRFLMEGRLPPPDAVRIEELINTFSYDYPEPAGEHPFALNVESAACPWAPAHSLVRIGLKASDLAARTRPPANLVFLVDVSGSMQPANKLPLVKRSLRLLVGNLGAADSVAMVVYAGAAGLVLPATPGAEQAEILDAIARLDAGGSTAGGQGINLAYKVARLNFIQGGINRVILATDGDFNVGVSDRGGLVRLIEAEAKSGVFLTVLGFGTGNLKDDNLEALADKGNGSYAYIDSLQEAHRVLVEQAGSTLVTVAKDVKIQVEFNPAKVAAYRLIGYENRLLLPQDFNDDSKDAGEMGAGHSVTALYEIVPAGRRAPAPSQDPLKYQQPARLTDAARGDELLTLKARYKKPDGSVSRLLEVTMIGSSEVPEPGSADTRFAAAVAAFGMLLRDGADDTSLTFDDVEALAVEGLARDPGGYRAGFVDLVRLARQVQSESR